jgi:4-hydroxy-tetrahydrodipicolinate synthase
MGARNCTWQGVFPAATTQFDAKYAVDLAATAGVLAGLIKDGVSGLIVCGTVGEGNTLSQAEKAAVIEPSIPPLSPAISPAPPRGSVPTA